MLAAAEVGADAHYVEALFAAHAEDTLLTDRFAPPCLSRRSRKRSGSPLHARVLRAAMDTSELFVAGESTGTVRSVQPAAAILHELADWAERLLTQAARLVERAPEPLSR